MGERAQRERERQAADRRVSEGERPWENERGVLSVVDAVRDREFPMTLEEIVSEVGDREVYTSKDIHFPLAYVALKLKEKEFTSLGDFQTAVQRHWEGIEQLEVPEEQKRKP